MASCHGQSLQRCALHKARSCYSLHSLRMTPPSSCAGHSLCATRGSGVRSLKKRFYNYDKGEKGRGERAKGN